MIRRPTFALVGLEGFEPRWGMCLGGLLLGLALGAVTPRRARAEAAPSPAVAPVGVSAGAGEPVHVELTVVGTPADLPRVRSVLEPWPIAGAVPHWVRITRFNPIEILQTIHDSRAVVRCWIDVSDRQRARLYFASPSGEQFLVRDVELSRRFEELDRESLSNVLELSIRALMENRAVGLTRDQARAVLSTRGPSVEPTAPAAPPGGTEPRPSSLGAPRPRPETPEPEGTAPAAPSAQPTAEPSPEPSAESTAESKKEDEPVGGLVTRRSTASSSSSTNGEAALAVRLGARVYYAVQSQGGGYPLAQGPGLLLEGVGARARSELGGWVSGQYRWPVRYAGTSAGVEVETVAARAGLGFALPVGALHLGARLGVGVDATHLSPRPGTIDSTATLTANRWTTSFVVTASIGLWRRLGSHLWGGVELLADALPQPVHYDQQVSGVTTEVAAPAWIRPGLLVSLGI